MSKSTCFKEWQSERFLLPTTNTTITLTGYSRAADKTSFYVKELKAFLDAGIVDSHKATHVFLTHCHQDHSLAVPLMLTGLWTLEVFCPSSMVPYMDNYIKAATSLNESRPYPSDPNCKYNLHGVRVEDTFTLPKNYTVKVIECDHSVDCVGYIFSLTKTKLLPQYVGLPGREIGALRKQGVTISSQLSTPAFTFLGDTTGKVFDDHPEMFDTSLIIVECSFILPEHAPLATKKKHMYWGEIHPHVLAHPNVTFVLTHWSHRYNKEMIMSFFEALDLPNVVPWVGAEES